VEGGGWGGGEKDMREVGWGVRGGGDGGRGEERGEGGEIG